MVDEDLAKRLSRMTLQSILQTIVSLPGVVRAEINLTDGNSVREVKETETRGGEEKESGDE